jgi:hypothetical protein
MIRFDKPLQTINGNSVRYLGEIVNTNKFTHAVAVTYVKDDTRWESVFIVDDIGVSQSGGGPGVVRIQVKNVTKSGWVAIPSGTMYVGRAIYETKEECEKNNAGFVDCVKIEWVE